MVDLQSDDDADEAEFEFEEFMNVYLRARTTPQEFFDSCNIWSRRAAFGVAFLTVGGNVINRMPKQKRVCTVKKPL